ncbi:hypothetical protein OKW50_003875 [Paraburkholderia youngii]|uniref:hypothetical protein n=1 Tax=Paraburkholderia youngii TaxID=2782701 RepID=UPI003D2533CE
MTSLSLGSFHEVRERRHGHFFSISLYRSFNLHIESNWLFDVDRWFHFALPASVPRESHDDIVQGMEEARAAWLRYSPSMLLSHQSHELRDMLGRSHNRFHMYRMKDDEVAKALYNEVKGGSLIFVPERDEMRNCVQAIREQREKASRAGPVREPQSNDAGMLRSLYGNSPRVPENAGTPSYSARAGLFSDAQPFQYSEDIPAGEDMQTAWLPSQGGPPNQWVENASGKKQWRLYDGDGNAAVDIDFGHDHGFGVPHSHNWSNGVRDKGNAFSLLPW